MTWFVLSSAQLVLKIQFKTIQLDPIVRLLLEGTGHRGFKLEPAKSKEMNLDFPGQAEVSPLRLNYQSRRQKSRDGEV